MDQNGYHDKNKVIFFVKKTFILKMTVFGLKLEILIQFFEKVLDRETDQNYYHDKTKLNFFAKKDKMGIFGRNFDRTYCRDRHRLM